MSSSRIGISVNKCGNPSIYSDFSTISSLIHDALIQGGLGQVDRKNPFMDIIEPGYTVLLKPNFVYHENYSGTGMECMTTQHQFILAVLKELTPTKPLNIIIGDAPIQSTDWNRLVNTEFIQQTKKICGDVNVEFRDFRQTHLKNHNMINYEERSLRKNSDYLEFDLKKDSLLEPISDQSRQFRCTSYDPRKMLESHSKGVHRYSISREIFDADVFLNLPKLKAHRKAGITAALKNVVGLVGDKSTLPHHRVGGSLLHGDCYKGLGVLKRLAEFSIDKANENIGTPEYSNWMRTTSRFLRLHQLTGSPPDIEGCWYGNNTIWRMVLDLNRIMLYGSASGEMMDTPQRKIWSLTDAIVCGEGEGPLSPTPKYVGAVTFSDSSSYVDLVHAALFRLDPSKISVINESFKKFRWPLVDNNHKFQIFHDGRRMSLGEIADKFGVTINLPHGWENYCEMNGGSYADWDPS